MRIEEEITRAGGLSARQYWQTNLLDIFFPCNSTIVTLSTSVSVMLKLTFKRMDLHIFQEINSATQLFEPHTHTHTGICGDLKQNRVHANTQELFE